MSRTIHHKSQKHRHNGHDLWSRRPNSGQSYSKIGREITKRKERMRDKQLVVKAIKGEEVRGQYPGE